MSSTTVYKIIGVYKIQPTIETIMKAVDYHGYDFLLNEDGEFTDHIYWDDLKNLFLIELGITGPFSGSAELSNIVHQDQAPYMEFFLDESGNELITEEQAVQASQSRVCFFLHDVNLDKPIEIFKQKHPFPGVTPLPDRLISFTHYLPVD